MKPSAQSLTDKLRTLYSAHDTLPKLIEDTKKAQSLDEY
ncbi:hypothetical protein RPK_04355 [Rickettsia rickettsii str. Hlp|nr:hypothetical protein RPK_04355 [Rickettsia rickettsii str. Hlp\